MSASQYEHFLDFYENVTRPAIRVKVNVALLRRHYLHDGTTQVEIGSGDIGANSALHSPAIALDPSIKFLLCIVVSVPALLCQ